MRVHLSDVAAGSARARLSASPARHAGATLAFSFLPSKKRGTRPDAAPVGSATGRSRCSGERRRPPRAWEEASRRAASEDGGHGHREARGRRFDARPASSPPAVEDGAVATVHQALNGFVQKVEGIRGNIPASLIEEWLGLELVTVDDRRRRPRPNLSRAPPFRN